MRNVLFCVCAYVCKRKREREEGRGAEREGGGEGERRGRGEIGERGREKERGKRERGCVIFLAPQPHIRECV